MSATVYHLPRTQYALNACRPEVCTRPSMEGELLQALNRILFVISLAGSISRDDWRVQKARETVCRAQGGAA